MSEATTARTTELRYDYYAIIPHPANDQFLLLPGDNGWGLPHFARHERRFWQDVAHVNQVFGEQLGLDLTVLRCVAIDYTPETEQVARVYAMENHSRAWTPPPGARWVGHDELDDLPFAQPQQRTAITDWLNWRNTAVPPAQRVPWFAPGWFAAAAHWISAQLQSLGLQASGPVEQLRSWQRSAILRINTTRGYCYFKAVPPMFAHEPRLTQVLAAHDPDHFPHVLALDTQRRWMLMADFGGTTLDRVDTVEQWEDALRVFAHLQIEWARRVDRLANLGCPDRPLERLTTQLDALFADTKAMLPDQPAGLSAPQIEQLRKSAPHFKAMCRKLADYKLPRSLEHGDFWAGQIVVNADNYIFIDWSDSSIAHPFFSMLFFLVEIEDFFPKTPDIRTRLRDAYLEPWTAFASRKRLIEAFELSQPLAALHHALIYHQLVLPNMEIKWEMELMLPFYLKMLLR